MTIKKHALLRTAGTLVLCSLLIVNCVTTPKAPDELDIAIRDASDYLNDNIPQSSKIVILNIQSESAALSDYIIDELIANAVNDRNFTVVDRAQLDTIRAEQNFQWSGEVDDRDALEIGRFFGAQYIVSGAFSELGERYRMRIRALNVQTAQVQGQYNRNINTSSLITALMKGGSYSGTSYSTRTTTAGATSTGRQTTQAATQPTVPIANGTYTFFPRPRAMRLGMDIDMYLDKIIVRGGFFNIYFVSVPLGQSRNLPPYFNLAAYNHSAIIQDANNPSRVWNNVSRSDTSVTSGYSYIWTFQNVTTRKFRLSIAASDSDFENARIFEEINLDNAEYEP